MGFSDEDRMRMHQENRDLLIEIKTITSKNYEQFSHHVEEDSRIQGELSKSLSAIHRRVDYLMISGVLGLIILVLSWLLKLSGQPG